MDRYKRLSSNVLILTIGTFSSKLLVFFLVPLYTRVLTEGQYGVVDLLVQTANLLIPAVSLGINQAVMRFGMDGKTDKRTVFSTGFAVNTVGYLLFLILLVPLACFLPITAGYRQYIPLVCLYVLISIFRQMCNQFVKSNNMVRRFALNGVISTAATIAYNFLFLLVLKLGIPGYLLAVICADVTSILYMLFAAKLWQYFDMRRIEKEPLRQMLRYSLPLIPTTALWWITDVSDRYMVAGWVGEAANGLYAVSYKIPTVIILLVGIFVDAWEMSILTEHDREERRKFFSNIFSLYQAVAFVAGSGLILFCKLVTVILAAPAYYASWQFVPVLLISTVFSCFVTFFSTIYVVEKRSGSALATSVVAAVANIVLNAFLIPDGTVHSLGLGWGVQGAAIATCVSYGLTFLIRAVHTHRLIPLNWNIPRFACSLLLLVAQAVVMVLEVPCWIVWEALMCAAMIVLNFKMLWTGLMRLLKRS